MMKQSDDDATQLASYENGVVDKLRSNHYYRLIIHIFLH